MSYEDVIKGLKVISTVTLGTFAGSSLHTAVAIQPSLIEESNVPAASRVRFECIFFSNRGLSHSLSYVILRHYGRKHSNCVRNQPFQNRMFSSIMAELRNLAEL